MPLYKILSPTPFFEKLAHDTALASKDKPGAMGEEEGTKALVHPARPSPGPATEFIPRILKRQELSHCALFGGLHPDRSINTHLPIDPVRLKGSTEWAAILAAPRRKNPRNATSGSDPRRGMGGKSISASLLRQTAAAALWPGHG